MSEETKPTELTIEDVEAFVAGLNRGDYDPKIVKCWVCDVDHFPNYGHRLGECDECFFSRFSPKARRKFYMSFLE